MIDPSYGPVNSSQTSVKVATTPNKQPYNNEVYSLKVG
jgi:hypothetical protein